MVDFFDKLQLDLFVRPVLQQKLEEEIKAQNWENAANFLRAFIDSWPIAASIATAFEHWNKHCDPMALAILSRANEIIILLDAPEETIPLPQPLPPYIEITGEDLAGKRGKICAQAAKKEIAAVLFSSPVPNDPKSILALGELYMEAPAQKAVDRYGLPGLLAPAAPPWAQALGRAPAGQMGETLCPMCDIAVLPGTPSSLRRGNPSPVGWLLWNGPARPLPIADVGLTLIRNISKGIDPACEEANISRARGMEIIGELVQIGALGMKRS